MAVNVRNNTIIPNWKVLLMLMLCGQPINGNADAIGMEIITLTSHISDSTIQLGEDYHRKLSDDGRHLITPGVELYYDNQIPYRSTYAYIDSLRAVAAGYYDSMNHFSGYIAYMPRWIIFKFKKTSLNFGIGPTLIFRESWKTIPQYRDDGYYQESENFLPGYQYKFILGGDINIHYEINNRLEAVWSIIPGLPYVITHAFGVRWKL